MSCSLIGFDYLLTALFSALLLGLVSSAHCLTMCGGVFAALSLSVRGKVQRNSKAYLRYLLAYNFGRISSYTLMGFLMAAVYWVALQLPWLEWGHQLLQIMGALVLFLVGLHWMRVLPSTINFNGFGRLLWRYLEPLGRRLLPVKTPWQALLYGFVWGWLPCGLVYTTSIYAVSQAGLLHPAWAMLAFGVGTLPSMLLVGFSTQSVLRLIASPRFRLLAGIMLCALSLLSLFLMYSIDHAHHMH